MRPMVLKYPPILRKPTMNVGVIDDWVYIITVPIISVEEGMYTNQSTSHSDILLYARKYHYSLDGFIKHQEIFEDARS